MGQRDKYTNGSLKGQILIDEKNGQILGYPLQQGYGVPNVMAGNFVGPGGVVSPTTSGYSGGFRVAKPGFDVRSATPDQLIFDSNQDVFKIVQSGTSICPGISFASPGAGNYLSGTNNTVVNHNLGYVPAIIAYGLFAAGIYSPLPIITNTGSGASAIWINNYIFADSTSVYFNTDVLVCGRAANVISLPVKYYLLRETSN